MPQGLHHIHKRKRIHHKKEKYPHPDKWKRFLDRLLIVVAIIGPLNAIPQIIKIYVYQQADAIASLTFGLYALFNIPWIFYGVVHKEPPIYIAYSLWLLANISIMIGSIIY